jgi:hypothetical protein
MTVDSSPLTKEHGHGGLKMPADDSSAMVEVVTLQSTRHWIISSWF